MPMISPAELVLHKLQRFELGSCHIESLEVKSPGFDAADDGIAGNRGRLGGSGFAKAFDSVVGDGGVGESAFAVGRLEAMTEKSYRMAEWYVVESGLGCKTYVISCKCKLSLGVRKLEM